MHEPTQSVNSIHQLSSNNSDLSTDIINIRRHILDTHIYPTIISNVEKNIIEIDKWNKLNKILIIIKYVCLAISPVITFTATTYSEHFKIMNLFSGILASLGITFDRLSNMCLQNKNKCQKLNDAILKSVNIDINKHNFNYTDETSSSPNNIRREPSIYVP